MCSPSVAMRDGSGTRERARATVLENISRRRKRAHRTLLSLKSKVYDAFLAMEKAAYADGVLPKKAKELIAVGISVVSRLRVVHAVAHRAGGAGRGLDA